MKPSAEFQLSVIEPKHRVLYDSNETKTVKVILKVQLIENFC